MQPVTWRMRIHNPNIKGYNVRCLRAEEYELWNGFVDRSPQGTVFHKSYWLNASGMPFVIYGCFRGSDLVAGIPLTYRSLYKWKVAVQPPLTPYMGVVFGGDNGKYVSRLSAEKELGGLLADQIKSSFEYASFSLPVSVVDLHPFKWRDFAETVRYTYILKLDSLADVWTEMDETRRRNIRKAEKDGLTIADDGSFSDLLDLGKNTFARQCLDLPFARKTAEAYNSVVQEKQTCRCFLIKNKLGAIVSGVYIVWDGKRSYYLLGGYSNEERHNGAGSLAMWAAIKFTKEKLGLSEFDFEGSSIPAIETFVRKFGGRLTPYYTVTWGKPHLLLALSAKSMLKRLSH